MGVEIIIADTQKQKEDAFQVRYEVFCKEGKWIPEAMCPHKMDSDEFDLQDSTIHFIAYDQGRAVATCRLLTPNQVMAKENKTKYGLRMEHDFDIAEYGARSIGEISRSSVLPSHRATSVLAKMYAAFLQYAKNQGITDIGSGINPDTDVLQDALLLWDIARDKGLMWKEFDFKPKHMIENSQVKAPLYDRTKIGQAVCLEDIREMGLSPEEMKQFSRLPSAANVFTKLGMHFAGKPSFDSIVQMYSIPINWNVAQALEKPYIKRVR